MIKIEERLVCIYEPFDYKRGTLFSSNVALVDYNTLTGSYVVRNGVYKGKTDKDFNRIKGNFSMMYGTGRNAYINKFMPRDLFIYIYENRDVNTVQDTLGVDRFEAYSYIAKHVLNTVLVPFEYRFLDVVYKSKLETNTITANVEKVLTEDYIYEQLYGEKMYEPEESDDKHTILYAVNGKDGSFRELNKDDLYEALPESIKKEVKVEVVVDASDVQEEPVEEIDVNAIISDISSKIVGQDEAIKSLVANIYYNQVLIDDLSKNGDIDLAELDARKIAILIDGSTGTGKTAIAKAVASKLNLPIVITNANSFSETGFVGPTITDMLKKLLKQANGDLDKAERGIIILDEVDKIAIEKERGRSMKKGVQEELLTFIGGGKYDIKTGSLGTVVFDTSKITFVLMGAFTEIREQKIKENESNKIGFGDSSDKDKTYTITIQDYIDYGLLREFFGRIKVLVSTNTYSKEDLTRILLTSTVSPLKNFEKNAVMFGYDGIVYQEDFIQKVVDEAFELNTGARSLQTVMLGIQNRLLLDMITNDSSDSLKLDDQVLEEYKQAKVIKY